MFNLLVNCVFSIFRQSSDSANKFGFFFFFGFLFFKEWTINLVAFPGVFGNFGKLTLFSCCSCTAVRLSIQSTQRRQMNLTVCWNGYIKTQKPKYSSFKDRDCFIGFLDMEFALNDVLQCRFVMISSHCAVTLRKFSYLLIFFMALMFCIGLCYIFWRPPEQRSWIWTLSPQAFVGWRLYASLCYTGVFVPLTWRGPIFTPSPAPEANILICLSTRHCST